MSYYAKRFFGQVQNEGIVTDGLKLWLDASNPASYPGTGTVWTDLSGNGNNGTLVNGVGFSNGVMVFDGVNDYVRLPVINSQEFTINTWFKPTGAPSNNDYNGGCVITDSEKNPPKYWISYSFTLKRFVIAINGTLYRLPFVVTNNQYYNVSLSTWLDSVANKRKIQVVVNNVNVYNYEQAFGNIVFYNSPASIGRWGFTGFERHFNGTIPEIEYYNRALTASEISHNFNLSRSKYGI